MIKQVWQGGNDEYGTYRAQVTVADGGTSDSVQIIYSSSRTSVGVYPEGEAYVVYTISTPAEVSSETAEWIKWPLGNLTAPDADSLISTATAVKLVSVSGSAKMDVVSQ